MVFRVFTSGYDYRDYAMRQAREKIDGVIERFDAARAKLDAEKKEKEANPDVADDTPVS
jgi:hypothetical protein